jgi:hypothetical protein
LGRGNSGLGCRGGGDSCGPNRLQSSWLLRNSLLLRHHCQSTSDPEAARKFAHPVHLVRLRVTSCRSNCRHAFNDDERRRWQPASPSARVARDRLLSLRLKRGLQPPKKKSSQRRNIAAPGLLAFGFSRTAWLPPRRRVVGIETSKSVGRGRPPPRGGLFRFRAYNAGDL